MQLQQLPTSNAAAALHAGAQPVLLLPLQQPTQSPGWRRPHCPVLPASVMCRLPLLLLLLSSRSRNAASCKPDGSSCPASPILLLLLLLLQRLLLLRSWPRWGVWPCTGCGTLVRWGEPACA
jgi:hypothetical protein